jgi:hypothetical protein
MPPVDGTVTLDTPSAVTEGDNLFVMFKASSAGTVNFWFNEETPNPLAIAWYLMGDYASFPITSVAPSSTNTERRFAAYVTYE